MKKKQHYITKGLVSIMLCVDPRQVERYEKQELDPLPVAIKGGNGKPHQYDLAAVHAWSIRKHLADISGVQAGVIYNFEEERARLTHEQADKVTLENAQLRGELIPREVVEATWTEMTAHMRGRLLGMPTKLAPAVQASEDLAEIRAVLTDGVHEALKELSTDGLPKDARARVEYVSKNINQAEATA